MPRKYIVKNIQEVSGKKKKSKFNIKKDNTLRSLREVEYFLCNFRKVAKGVKLYKILK